MATTTTVHRSPNFDRLPSTCGRPDLSNEVRGSAELPLCSLISGRLLLVASQTLSVVVATIVGGSLAACGDRGSTESARASNSVCFELGSNWEFDGRFQQSFLGDDREMLPGMTGFTLHLSPYFLQIDLGSDVDPELWIAQLRPTVKADPAVESTYIGACQV